MSVDLVRKSLDIENQQPRSTSVAPIKISNQQILIITTILFGGFVTAEIIGALASNSLALLGDASAMMVDVFTVNKDSLSFLISLLFLFSNSTFATCMQNMSKRSMES